MTLPVYIDIDGTLTAAPTRQWGAVYAGRLDAVRDLIVSGRPVVLWSGGGTGYASAFAVRHRLQPLACLGKPALVVDDNPLIRPAGRMPVVAPEDFFGR